MSDEALTRFVAERVMEWTAYMREFNGRSELWWDTGHVVVSFDPLASADDDYKVLCKVREGWEHYPFADFVEKVRCIQYRRLAPFMEAREWGGYPDGNRTEAMYEPGDFARAAAAVMGFKETESGREVKG